MADEDKYEFNLSDPDSWTKMPRPFLSEGFVAETLRVGGLTKSGKPRFKWSWGMSEEVYVDGDQFIQSGWYLKYELCTTGNKLVGFRWQSDNGTQHFVADMRQIPAGVVAALPVYKREQVGTPRWVLEEWREEGDCNGMFDRAGYYFHRWIVQDDKPENPETLLKPYREPNQKDLEILAQYVQLVDRLTADEIRQGVKADREREVAALAKSRAEAQSGIAEALVEIMTDMPRENCPIPSKAVADRAWKQLRMQSHFKADGGESAKKQNI